MAFIPKILVKFTSQNHRYLYSRNASTQNVATAAANECVGSAKGDELDELVVVELVVEIKKFVWLKLMSRTTSYLQQPSTGWKYL